MSERKEYVEYEELYGSHVNVAYDNKVTINTEGLAFPTVGELCKAISEQQSTRQRLNNYMW